jgi:hypothetical protein
VNLGNDGDRLTCWLCTHRGEYSRADSVDFRARGPQERWPKWRPNDRLTGHRGFEDLIDALRGAFVDSDGHPPGITTHYDKLSACYSAASSGSRWPELIPTRADFSPATWPSVYGWLRRRTPARYPSQGRRTQHLGFPAGTTTGIVTSLALTAFVVRR